MDRSNDCQMAQFRFDSEAHQFGNDKKELVHVHVHINVHVCARDMLLVK